MKKILIIEDDQLVANIYRNKFSTENFDAAIAADGTSGFAQIDLFRPDLVILDLMLPGVTGLEVLKQIRSRDEWRELPVIVFSNTYLSSVVQEAWKAGATKCLTKANCTPKQIVDVVRGVLSPVAPLAPKVVPDPPSRLNPAKPAAEPQSAAPATPLSEADADAAFQSELRQSFLATLPGILAVLRVAIQTLAKTPDEAGRVRQLQELYRRIHSLTGNAGIVGLSYIAQLSDALEALLKELYEKPSNINPSTLRTVALAVDFLGVLFERSRLPDATSSQGELKASVLVVDDEVLSRRAVAFALEKARLTAVSMEKPEAALDLLAERQFDLIFLDVDMPNMNGYELCTKLRALHRNKTTPVIFVTSLNDFENRANSTMSGGNDFLGKPFIFMELAVKALVFILRSRLAAK